MNLLRGLTYSICNEDCDEEKCNFNFKYFNFINDPYIFKVGQTGEKIERRPKSIRKKFK